MELSNWNKIPKVKVEQLELFDAQNIPNRTIARGYGNTYGDASLNEVISDMTNQKNLLKIDNDVLEVSSGYQLSEVLKFTIAKGFILPVIPGTQYVSIGGMVAADVHGKNHEQNGSIGNWIKEISIYLSSDKLITCSEEKNFDLFKSTIGGMGLTGVINSVKIQLQPFQSQFLNTANIEFDNIDELLQNLEEAKTHYKIGWTDLVSKPSQFFLTTSDYSNNKSSEVPSHSERNMPNFGVSLLNKLSISVFNKRNAKNLRSNSNTITNIWDSLFPLDRVKNWNNAYGRKGFYQYQFVIPYHNKTVIKNLFEDIEKSPHTPYLISLKYFGKIFPKGLMSFPEHGFSVAIDFKNEKGIVEFMSNLNSKVIQSNGKIYLAKDCIMNREDFEEMYPNIGKFESCLEKYNRGNFESYLSKRLKIKTNG